MLQQLLSRSHRRVRLPTSAKNDFPEALWTCSNQSLAVRSMVGSPACSVGTSDAAALLPLAKGMSDAPHAPERKAAFLAKFEAANQPSCGLPVLRSLRHTSRSESAQNDTSCQDGANSLSSSGTLGIWLGWFTARRGTPWTPAPPAPKRKHPAHHVCKCRMY